MTIVHTARCPTSRSPTSPSPNWCCAEPRSWPAKPAISDVGSGRGYTFGELSHAIRALAGGPAGPGLRPRGHARHHGAQRARVRRGVPRRRRGRRHQHHHQPHLHGRRDPPPAAGLEGHHPRHHRDVPRDGSGRHRGHRRDRDRHHGRRRGHHCAGRSHGRSHRPGPRRRRRPRRRAAVLIGHHRPAQGSDAHPSQPGGQHSSSASRSSPTKRARWRSPRFRSSTSTACRCS